MSNLAHQNTLRPGIDLLCPEHLANPFPTYAKMREHYPVCQVEQNNFWAVSRFDDVRFVLKRHDLFSTGYNATFQADWLPEDCKSDRFIAAFDPPEHTRRRALINKAFVGRVINAQIPIMQQASQSLLSGLTKKEPMDFLEDFAFPYVGSFIGKIIGTERQQSLKELQRWMQMEEQLTPSTPEKAFREEFTTLIRKQHSYFINAVTERRAHLQNDLTSALIEAELDGERLSDTMIRDALALLVGSGYQTPIQTLCACILQLSRNPKLLATLRHSPALIPAFVEEMLRFDPGLHSAFREAACDVEIAGVTIPKGAFVVVMLAAANRDPSKFPNPDTIDLSRPNVKEHLGFGYGVHTCIGEALARLEIKVALEALLERFSSITCPPNDQLPWAESIFVRGLLKLPIRFQ